MMSPTMDVVVLAAGLGRRLGVQSDVMPKCVTSVGGTPLLVRSLGLLRSHGFRNVIVVTGHLSRLVRAAVEDNGFSSIVRFVENDAYRDTGTARSLYCASTHLQTDHFLLLEADLLFSSRFLIEARHRAPRPTVFTASQSGSGDEVFVLTSAGGQPLEIAKQISTQGRQAIASGAASLSGELAGISILPRSFVEYLGARRGTERFDRRDYESFIVEFASRTAIEVCWLKGVPWTEIDNLADLERAKEIVWPRLVQEGTAA
jgi:choline kinase